MLVHGSPQFPTVQYKNDASPWQGLSRRSVGISLFRWELRMVPLPNVLLCWQPQNSCVEAILNLGIEHRTAVDPVPDWRLHGCTRNLLLHHFDPYAVRQFS